MNPALFLCIWPQINCWSQPVFCGLLLAEFFPGQLDKSCGDKYNAYDYCNWTGAGSANISTECTFSLSLSVILLNSLYWRSWRSWLYKWSYWYISCLWEINWNTLVLLRHTGRTTYSFAGKCDCWTVFLRVFFKDLAGTSLMVQGLRNHLPTQGMWVQSLAGELRSPCLSK